MGECGCGCECGCRDGWVTGSEDWVGGGMWARERDGRIGEWDGRVRGLGICGGHSDMCSRVNGGCEKANKISTKDKANPVP